MKKIGLSLLAAVTAAVATVSTVGLASAAAAGPSLRVLPLGDSITAGYGSSTGSSYRAELWNTVTGAGYPLDFVGSQRSGALPDTDNEGHYGWRIDQIAGIAPCTLSGYRPNIVTLHIGTNDMGQNYEVSTAPARLGALIDQILAAAPDTTVLVASLVPSSSPDVQARIAAFNREIPGLVQQRRNAGKHVQFVDMSAVTTADLSDSLHPNDGGYRKMATAFYGGIQQVLAAGWVANPVSTPGTGCSGSGSVLRGQESGRCADVPGGAQTNGTAVALWDCNGGANQRWTATASRQLQVYGTKCLDATGGGTADGTAVIIWDCTGGSNQQWTVNSDGTVVGVGSGKCLDANAHGTANGTRLQLWTCNGGANQKWSRN